MWNRANLKENAKVAFKRNYWKCILVAIILGITTASGSVGSTVSQNGDAIETYMESDVDISGFVFNDLFNFNIFPGKTMTILLVILIIAILVIGLTVQFFLFGPLEIGCYNFFKANAYEQADLNKITIGFQKEHYLKMASTMFLRNLYIGLWMLLLIIPGIIKSYEYRMIPFILTDCPDIPRQEAFRISKEMMMGNKMKTFLLDLSFFGWILLATITCGIAGIFYVKPYIAATEAELFIAVREEYFKGQKEEVHEDNLDNSRED